MESAVRSSMRLKLCVPGGPDIDMRALAVLVTQPFDCLLDLDGALPFSENHLAGVAPDAKIKALAAIARSWARTSRSTITADFSPRFFRSASVIGGIPRPAPIGRGPRHILRMEPLRSPQVPRLRLRPAPRAGVRGTGPAALRSPHAGACRRRFCPQILACATGLQRKPA